MENGIKGVYYYYYNIDKLFKINDLKRWVHVDQIGVRKDFDFYKAISNIDKYIIR